MVNVYNYVTKPLLGRTYAQFMEFIRPLNENCLQYQFQAINKFEVIKK